MAYLDTTQDPALRTSYAFGDKPYGNFWKQVADDAVPPPPAAPAPMPNDGKLVDLLVTKGVITAQDKTTLFQASKIPA